MPILDVIPKYIRKQKKVQKVLCMDLVGIIISSLWLHFVFKTKMIYQNKR